MTVIEPTLRVERELLRLHAVVIACDEVGRGSLAGPVAVGAVAVDARSIAAPMPAGLRDSKLVSARRRPDVAARSRSWVRSCAVGWAAAYEIDEFGIVRALGMAASRAIAQLPVPEPAVVLLDGNHDYITPVHPGWTVVTRTKADRDCASVAAASVVAKVARDAHMVRLHTTWPAYGWADNKGYGSAAHRTAIAAHGVTPEHRVSWRIGEHAPRE